MSRSVNTPIKIFIPQITVTIYPSVGHRGVLKLRSYSCTSSAPVNIMVALSPVPDPDWSLYDEHDYIGLMYTLDIHSIHTSKINKATSNPRGSRHHGTSNPSTMCGNAGHKFDECELLKTMTSLKIHCIQFSLRNNCSVKLHLQSYLEMLWSETGYFGPLRNNLILFIILLYLI